jgi:hypothetical protein
LLTRLAEYIAQLEDNFALKANENKDLRIKNRALIEENARSITFIETLLRHPALNPFLEDLSRDETIGNPILLPSPAAPTE